VDLGVPWRRREELGQGVQGLPAPLQVSQATRAAGTHLGPRALALAADLDQAKRLTVRRTCAVILTLISLLLHGRIRHLSTMEGLRIIDELEAIPGKVYPIALEGALKMKEISYVHASGYASAS
jgi:hypothetical protein